MQSGGHHFLSMPAKTFCNWTAFVDQSIFPPQKQGGTSIGTLWKLKVVVFEVADAAVDWNTIFFFLENSTK